MKIKKYLAYYKIIWQDNINYRMNLLVLFLASIVFLISLFYLWEEVFQNKETILGYTKKQMLSYYLLAGYLAASFQVFVPIASEIRNGVLSSYLIKPVNYLWHHYWKLLSLTIFTLLIGLPVMLIIFFVFKEHLFLALNLKSYILLIITSLGALNIFFLFFLLVSFLEFWILYSDEGFFYIFNITASFLAGTLIPLTFLPGYIQIIGSFLPFKYANYFVINVFLGNLTNYEIIKGLLLQTVWSLLLLGLVIVVWKIGIKKYEGVGS